jgi:hypothetical protein
MKRIWGFGVFALVAVGGTEHVAVCGAAENPDAGRKREFRVVADRAEFQRRLDEVAVWKDRVAFMDRWNRKCCGWMAHQLAADKESLRRAEMALDRLRTEFKRFRADLKGPVANRAIRGE